MFPLDNLLRTYRFEKDQKLIALPKLHCIKYVILISLAFSVDRFSLYYKMKIINNSRGGQKLCYDRYMYTVN